MAITWTQPELLVAKGVMALTETAPTDAGEGVSMKYVKSLTIVLEAEATRTITGGANNYLRAYYYDASIGGWGRFAELDIAIPTTVGGNRRATFSIQKILPERGRIAYITEGPIVVSGGTTVTIYHITQTRL